MSKLSSINVKFPQMQGGRQGNTVGLTSSPTGGSIPGRHSERRICKRGGIRICSLSRDVFSRRLDSTIPDSETPAKEMVYLGHAALTLVRFRMVLDRRHSAEASNEYNNRCIEN